jgi:hypothetical protein
MEQVEHSTLHETITRTQPARNDLVTDATNKGNGEIPPKPINSSLTLLLTFLHNQQRTWTKGNDQTNEMPRDEGALPNPEGSVQKRKLCDAHPGPWCPRQKDI